MSLDRERHLVRANERAAQLFGYSDAAAFVAAVGARDFGSLCPDLVATLADMPSNANALACTCYRGALPWPARLTVLARDDGWTVLVQEPTMAASRQLEHAQTVLDSLLNALPNPVFIKDEAHRWVMLNESFCALLGRTREELLGRSDYDFFPRAEADTFWEKDNQVFASGETNENEELFTDASGELHVILTRKSLRHDADGRPLLLGVITDISERKRMERELRASRDALDQRVAERTHALARANARLRADIVERERVEQHLRDSERRFRMLADSMPQIVWTCDAAGRIEYLNVRWYEYTGGISDNGDEDWLAAVAPDEREEFAERYRRALAGGEPFQGECRLCRADGALRWHLVRAAPGECAEGCAPVRWFGTMTDIEDQKSNEQRLVEVDQNKNHFLAMLGHELRNPLTPIRTAAWLVGRGLPEGSPAARPLAIIERQVALMARLIDDLLDVSRISRGKIRLQREPVDLTALVRTVLDDRRDGFAARGLALDASLPNAALDLFGDPVRLAQVLGNLLDNAEKFTDRGGRLRVELRGDADHAQLTVADTGVGMDAETLARLFRPFSQADSTLARNRGGLGLGLSLVKGLVELHGGSISAASEGPGEGARFTVTLPLLAAADAPVTHEPAPVARTAAGRRVLVVEDNADAAESLRLALESCGHTVEIAPTGEDALARARHFRPDVVLSDIRLPGATDGYALARALRADPELSAAKLVAVTGFGLDDDRRRAVEAGFDRHVTKPFEITGLQRLIGELAVSS